MRKRFLSVLTVGALVAALTACGTAENITSDTTVNGSTVTDVSSGKTEVSSGTDSSTADTSGNVVTVQNTDTAENKITLVDSTVYGTITEIDETSNTITVSLITNMNMGNRGNMGGNMQMPGNMGESGNQMPGSDSNSGTIPEKPGNNSESSSDTTGKSDSGTAGTDNTATGTSVSENTSKTITAIGTSSTSSSDSANSSSTDTSSNGTAPSDMGTAPSDMGNPPSDMGTAPSDMGNPPSDMGNAAGAGTPPAKPGETGSTDTVSTDSIPEKPSDDANAADTANDTSNTSNTTDTSNTSNTTDTNFDSIPAKPGNDTESNTGNSDSDSGFYIDNGKDSGNFGSFDMSDMFGTVTADIVVGDTSVLKDSDGNQIEFSALTVDSYISITFDSEGTITEIKTIDESEFTNSGMNTDFGSMGGNMGGNMGFGGGTAVTEYDSLTEITENTEITGETYTSTGKDENAILVNSDVTVTLSDVTVTRDSDDSTGGDNSSFYGVGAAILNTSGTVTIENSTITTDAAGGAGVFSYGTGVTYVKNVTITTTEDTSGGIHAAGGGTLYAEDCTVETSGESSAAIRSDRGGGTMVVEGGTYTSNGTGSPAVYCTADITVSDATLTATGSEAVCIEGLNTLTLIDSDLSGNMSDNSQNDCTWNIIVYQSMSGDSEIGNGTFNMVGGSITAANGGMFYTTNTECTFYLSDVDITYASDNDFFLKVTGNKNQRGWGTSGNNGSDCLFTAVNQNMTGDIIYDSISTLDLYMADGSTLTGSIIDDETCAGNGGNGYCNVYISSDSVWTVTGNSTVTNLYNEGTICDAAGNTVSIVGTDGTVYVQGTSEYTVTVSSYSATADFTGMASAPEV